jgi:hypothetical protein
MTDDQEYITAEALAEFLLEVGDRRLLIKRYISESTFVPEVHVVLPMSVKTENQPTGRVV